MYSCNFWTYHEHNVCYCHKDKNKRLLPIWIIQAVNFLWYDKVEYKSQITEKMVNELNYRLKQDEAKTRFEMIEWFEKLKKEWILYKKGVDPNYATLKHN